MTDIAWVTCEEFREPIPTEKEVIGFLVEEGVSVDVPVWDDPLVDWKNYKMIIVRSAWDYHRKVGKFLDWLSSLEGKGLAVYNPVEIQKWNHHKFYLRDLEQQGINIVPTTFLNQGEGSIEKVIHDYSGRDLIVKPAISATAHNLVRLESKSDFQDLEGVKRLQPEMDLLVQDFQPEIVNQGEWSLMFFNKEFSHSVLKRPQKGEFRVQNNFGGSQQLCEPDQTILQEAGALVNGLSEDLLYARVDGIVSEGHFQLMELELIEPELFLLTEEARRNFFKAIMKRL